MTDKNKLVGKGQHIEVCGSGRLRPTKKDDTGKPELEGIHKCSKF